MLDVHAPESGIHGVRDFFIHLLTITAGLLIAIALEQSVETLHHRHQRNEADAEIRQEIRENRDEVVRRQATLQGETKDLVNVLGYIDARLAKQPVDGSKQNIQLAVGPLNDSAWRTAMATGVVAYMDYGTVEQFASCYKEQEQYEHMEDETVKAYLIIESFVAMKKPNDLSDEELRAVQPAVRQALANLGALRDISGGVVEAYDKALGK